MRVLAKANISLLPGPDDYFAEPQGMVTLGQYVIHGVRVATSDWSAHDHTMVLRSLKVTTSGASVVSTLRIKPPVPGPTGGNGMASVNAVMTMSKLDDSRMLVVITQGRYQFTYDGATDSDEPILALVVGCDSGGRLTQGEPVTVGQAVLVDGALVGHLNLGSMGNGAFPAAVLDSNHVIMFANCLDAAGDPFMAAATFEVIGMVVGSATWAQWAGLGPAYAFIHGGSPYVVDLFGPSVIGADGTQWPFKFASDGSTYNQMMRSATVGGTTWLLGDVEVARFTADGGPQLMGWGVTGQDREFGTSNAWSYFSERDLVTPRGQFLVWDLWDSLRIAAVAIGGQSYEILDLGPHLPEFLALDDLEGDLEAGTIAVVGRLGLVEVTADHLDPTEVDSWGMGARYLVIELVPAPKLGPGVQGAHFD